MFLLSKRTMAGLIERRIERGGVLSRLSNGKYSSPRVVNERIRETNRQIVDDNSFLF